MQRPDELTLEEIRAYLGSQAPPERPPAHLRAYREAAAVLAAISAPERLRPAGEAPPGQATELLGPDLIPATGAAFNGRVMLAPEIRAETVRQLISAGRVELALAANPAERHSLLQTHLENYLRHEGRPLDGESLAGLDAILQVAVWLADVVDGVPPVEVVAARAGYQRLLAPFETLAGDAVFRGRRDELDRLRRYVGVVPPESAKARLRDRLTKWAEAVRQPAVSISGIGGSGKSSLVARFMLEHTRLPEEERIPFGYLDFARTSLDIGNPVSLSAELLRQLDLQFPGVEISRGFRFLDEWLPGSAAARVSDSAEELALRARGVLADILGTLHSLLGPRPYVVVLDTFEEVQYRGEARALPFWELLSSLQEGWPFLRIVVAGRAPVETLRLAGREARHIQLGELDAEAAAAFLGTQGIEDPQAQRDLIATFGSLPLSLKLVGSLAARTPGGAAALLSAGNGLSLLTASDEIIQAQLYGRILDHIADPRIRRIAHPGLTLRRINPAVILNVLNGPCELLISSMDEATALFEALRRESSLVSVDSDDGDLVHRPDLRRVMLKMLLAGAPAVAEQIHRRAAAWYRGQFPLQGGWPTDAGDLNRWSERAAAASDFLNRQGGRRIAAEYFYHRLCLSDYNALGWNRSDAALLSDREVRASIQAVIDEFPVEVQLWLGTQGYQVPPQVAEQATRDQQHAAVAAQVEDLLPYGDSGTVEAERVFQLAYQDLREGTARSLVRSALGLGDQGASPVFRAGARIAAQQGDTAQALNLIEQGLKRSVRDGTTELTLGLLKDRAWLYRDRPPAEQAEGLALLADYARRHEDLAGQIEHRALLLGGERSAAAPADLAALAELLSQATPYDAWDLLPALGRALAFATLDGPFQAKGNSDGADTADGEAGPLTAPALALADPLASLIQEPTGPFRVAAFLDSGAQSALNETQRLSRTLPISDGAEHEESSVRTTRLRFIVAFLRLCEAWPYRILYVSAPQGRRGEKLAIP